MRFTEASFADALAANPRPARLDRRSLRGALRSRRSSEAGRATRVDGIEARARRPRSTRSRASTRTASCARSSKWCRAAVRTNAYRDGLSRRCRSSSIPAALAFLPAPRPAHEIWVYSPRVEAVHLRGGDIARGGIRWSDRRDDFRTEVLGLMKAQTEKNAVIVPVGAKGGFVVKRPPADAPRCATRCSSATATFVRGLLDVTDNLVDGAVVPPPTSCATTTTIPISSSPPTRAPRRSPTSPTSSQPSTATGSATRSRPGGRRVTTTRRWGSRRAARGSRCVRTSARWVSTPTPRSSRWSGSATCRATSSATACCARST